MNKNKKRSKKYPGVEYEVYREYMYGYDIFDDVGRKDVGPMPCEDYLRKKLDRDIKRNIRRRKDMGKP